MWGLLFPTANGYLKCRRMNYPFWELQRRSMPALKMHQVGKSGDLGFFHEIIHIFPYFSPFCCLPTFTLWQHLKSWTIKIKDVLNHIPKLLENIMSSNKSYRSNFIKLILYLSEFNMQIKLDLIYNALILLGVFCIAPDTKCFLCSSYSI